MKKFILYVIIFCFPIIGYSQYNQYYKADSTKAKYPYTFPIFGNFLHDTGIDLPYPVGIMVNYYHGNQGILIPDIAIGFSRESPTEIPLTDITRIIDFEDISANVNAINVRPDIWVLPFLNIYGIFGKTYSTTTVKISYPFNFTAVANLDGFTAGVGMTFAGGYEDYFFVLDMNNVWTTMSNFAEPVKTSVLSPRIGRTFRFKSMSRESNFGFWLGAMRVDMGGVTDGQITLKEVLPDETWQKRDEIVDNYYEWYNGIDENKQNVADQILTPIVENISDADGSGTIRYSITKQPVSKWNMLIGAQYQYNKHWMVRSEFGLLGSRTSFLISLNYRFGIKHIK